VNLELREENGGLRHYLDGKPVHCGQQLQLLTGDDHWVCARYEASFRCNCDQVSVQLITPFGYVLPSKDTKLRWPKEAA
jgi:hypothetical protein